MLIHSACICVLFVCLRVFASVCSSVFYVYMISYKCDKHAYLRNMIIFCVPRVDVCSNEIGFCAATIPQPESFKCPHCPASFLVPENLKTHLGQFHSSEKRKAEEENGTQKKKPRRARKRLDDLDDEGKVPVIDDEDDDVINDVVTSNWGAIKTRTRVMPKSTFINLRFREASPPDFEVGLRPFFEV